MEGVENKGFSNTPEAPEPEVSPQALVIENPATEKADAGASEFHGDLLRNRNEAVSTIMEQGLAKEKYPDLWEKVGSYTMKALREKQPADIASFLADEESAKEYSQVAGQMQEGMSLNDLLSEQEAAPVPSTLRAIEVLSKVMNESLRGGKDWKDTEGDEASRRLLRTSEIVNVYAKAIKVRHDILTPEEKNHASTYEQQFTALSQSDDVPEIYQRWFVEAAHNLRVQEIVTNDTPAVETPAEPEQEQTVEEPATPAEEQPEAPVATPEEKPVSESEPQKIEKVFGREAIKKEDIIAAEQEITALLKEKTPEATFKAARELAYLKRAGFSVVERQRERVFGQLAAQREAMRDEGAGATARYLTFLKYIGAIEGATPEEKTLLENGIKERTDQGGRSNLKSLDLSALCMNAHYAGIELNGTTLEPHFAQEIEAVNKPGEEHRVAIRLARARYLEIKSERLTAIEQSTRKTTDAKVAEFRAKGLWGKFARLKLIVDYLRGEPTTVDEKAQESLVAYTEKKRKSSQETGKWNQFASYIADILKLSKRKEVAPEQIKKGEDPAKEFLSQLSEDEIEPPEKFLAGLSKEHQAADEKGQEEPPLRKAA
ncbi:MAG: hypothetical protein WEC84_04165 [Candidatus Andersenbacteria bacterium]